MDSPLPCPAPSAPALPLRPRQVVLRSERLRESVDLKRPPFCKLDQFVTYSECAHITYNLKCGRSRTLWDLWWAERQCNRFSVRVFALPPSLKLRWFSAHVTIRYSGIWWCVDGQIVGDVLEELAASFLNVTIYRSTQQTVSEGFNLHHGCELWELKSHLHKS